LGQILRDAGGDREILDEILDIIGKPIILDLITAGTSRGRFSRLSVEVDLEKLPYLKG